MLAILTDEEDDNDMTNSLHLKMIGYIYKSSSEQLSISYLVS